MPLVTLSQTQGLTPERLSSAQEAARPACAQRTELPQSTYRSDPSSERPLALHSNPQSLKLLKKSSISRTKSHAKKWAARATRFFATTPLGSLHLQQPLLPLLPLIGGEQARPHL